MKPTVKNTSSSKPAGTEYREGEPLSFVVDHDSYSESWRKRLEVFRDVFPWVNETIKEIAGLAATSDLASHEEKLAFLRTHAEYLKGGNSRHERIRLLHHRQNEAWTELTGLPPLGTARDWRAAGIAAMAPQAVLDDLRLQLQSGGLSRICSYVIPWAQQLWALHGRHSQIPPNKRTKPLTKKKAARLLGRTGNENRAVEWLNACINDGEIRYEMRSRQSGIYHLDDFPESCHSAIRA